MNDPIIEQIRANHPWHTMTENQRYSLLIAEREEARRDMFRLQEDVTEARDFIATLPDLTPEQYSKTQCEKLHKALLHISFLLAKTNGVSQEQKPPVTETGA